MLKKILLTSYLIIIFFFMVILQLNCTNTEKKEITKEEMVKRGAYLANLSGCNHCHSPKVFTAMGPILDTTKILSGHPETIPLLPFDPNIVQPGKWYLAGGDLTTWVGPWGVSFAANLTPDEPTGLGTWTEEIFIKAMRTGKHMGIGRPILPPMPWEDIGKSTDEDLKSIFAYLKSLPPVHNKVPDPVPPDKFVAAE